MSVFRNLLMAQGKKGRLPSGYTEVEWIENVPKKTKIYLNYIPNINTKIEVEMSLSTLWDAGPSTAFGLFQKDGAENIRFQYIPRVEGYRGSVGIGKNSINTNIPKLKERIIVILDAKRAEAYINDVKVEGTFDNSSMNNTNISIAFFGRNGLDPEPINYKYKLYKCKIYENNNISVNLIPCVAENGRVGMYDIVQNIFYDNSFDDTNIIAGPVVDPAYPSWFTESLVCWYDPKKQGLTNEQIIAENSANGYFLLKDHSRNGLDMKCYGFEGTETSGVSGDSLHFDGLNTYGEVLNRKPQTDFTILTKRINAKRGGGAEWKVFSATRKDDNIKYKGAFLVDAINEPSWHLQQSFGSDNNLTSKDVSSNILCMTPNKYNDKSLDKGTAEDTTSLYIGASGVKKDIWVGDLYNYLLFNRTLAQYEIDWVKENIMGEPKPPKQDYIQDGLAFHLDCRDAKPSADGNNWQWVDRIGKIPFDMTAVLQQADKGLVFVADSLSNGQTPKGVYDILSADVSQITIEAVFKQNINDTAILFDTNFPNSYNVSYYMNTNIIYSNLDHKSYNTQIKLYNTLSVSDNCAYHNKKKLNAAPNNLWGTAEAKYATIGCRIQTGSKANFFNGVLYSIRVYKRHLTEEEVLHNQDIDNQIFKLGI